MPNTKSIYGQVQSKTIVYIYIKSEWAILENFPKEELLQD